MRMPNIITAINTSTRVIPAVDPWEKIFLQDRSMGPDPPKLWGKKSISKDIVYSFIKIKNPGKFYPTPGIFHGLFSGFLIDFKVNEVERLCYE